MRGFAAVSDTRGRTRGVAPADDGSRTRGTKPRRIRMLRRGSLGMAAVVAVTAAIAVPALGTGSGASAPPAPSDQAMAASPFRPGLTGEQYYFVMPDRFADGNTANDAGGLTGGRTSTGFDPTDKGYYHGGDLQGITD